MKKMLIVLAVILPAFAIAQMTAGKVVYEEQVKFEIDLPEEAQEFKHMIPHSQTIKKTLLFNETASLYKDMEEGDDEEVLEGGSEEGNVQFKMVMMRPDNQLYKDLEKGEQVELRDLFGKKFLISGAASTFAWKLTGEQTTIQDHLCQQAIYKDSSRTVEAWFSPQIPVSTGPDSYGQLPGLILEVNINEGERVVTATKISLEALPEDAIKAPKKGKSVSNEEFEKILKEKTKEMAEEMGGGGNVQIRIRN